MTVWTLPGLSRELVGPLTVAVDDDPVTDWTYLLVHQSDTPDTPEAINRSPVAVEDGLWIPVGPGTVNPLTWGVYRIWVRYVGLDEAPVLNNHLLVIT